jgi:hypothetical protein
MQKAELEELVRSARWFSNLGGASVGHGFVAVNDLAAFQRFVDFLTAETFGLTTNVSLAGLTLLREMDWLPTTQDEPDPFNGKRLITLAEERRILAEVKLARTEAFKLAQLSLRPIAEVSVLQVGGSNLLPAARAGALYAVRMAATEIGVEQPGRWCEIVRLYHVGQWPVGKLRDGTVVVL